MRSEVIGGLTIGAKVDGLIIGRASRWGLINLWVVIIVVGENGQSTVGEEEVHAVEGAAGTIGLGPDLAGADIVGAAVVPLVTLLDSDEGLPAAMGGDVEVVQVRGYGGYLGEPMVGAGGGGCGRRQHKQRDLLERLLPPSQYSRHNKF